MEPTAPDSDVTMAEAQQAVAQSVLTELELGITFLDVAANTGDARRARQNIKNAIIALRTADRFLLEISPDRNSDAIQQRRKQLAERLHAITDADDASLTRAT